MKELTISTNKKIEMLDITSMVKSEVMRNGVKNGICYLFVPHTTAGIIINEDADPNVVKDIETKLNEIAPLDEKYYHTEGNAHSHIKSSIVGVSQTIFIENGEIILGRWQGIFFCEFDGPRKRRVLLKIVKTE
jgi:secondary thiamine-phosphate synthase enzyme